MQEKTAAARENAGRARCCICQLSARLPRPRTAPQHEHGAPRARTQYSRSNVGWRCLCAWPTHLRRTPTAGEPRRPSLLRWRGSKRGAWRGRVARRACVLAEILAFLAKPPPRPAPPRRRRLRLAMKKKVQLEGAELQGEVLSGILIFL